MSQMTRSGVLLSELIDGRRQTDKSIVGLVELINTGNVMAASVQLKYIKKTQIICFINQHLERTKFKNLVAHRTCVTMLLINSYTMWQINCQKV